MLHDWCNKGCGMCYPACGMVHIKEPLLLIGKSSLCGGSRFPHSLSEWSFTICVTSYNQNVLSASLNKIFPSFLSNCYITLFFKLVIFFVMSGTRVRVGFDHQVAHWTRGGPTQMSGCLCGFDTYLLV